MTKNTLYVVFIILVLVKEIQMTTSEKYFLVFEGGLVGVGEEVISIYCSGDGGSDPVSE